MIDARRFWPTSPLDSLHKMTASAKHDMAPPRYRPGPLKGATLHLALVAPLMKFCQPDPPQFGYPNTVVEGSN